MSAQTPSMQPPVTRVLAEHACAAHRIDASRDALDIACRSLIDTMGVTIAAAGDEAVHILRRASAGTTARGRSTLLVDGAQVDAQSAALINGTAAHALDFDHGASAMHGHPGAVLWPAVLAVGEEVGASGHDLLEAFIAGFTVAVGIARGLDLAEHYVRGWHATSTTAVFGAAAAAARLMGLDAERTAHALGLAGSMASGSRQNFGTMTKPLHTGKAARDGVLAAKLAARGFTADPTMIEGPLGFFALYCEKPDPARAIAAVSGPAPITADYSIGAKSYPCCYSAHRAITAALMLRREEGIDAGEVERVRITLEPRGFESLIQHRPTNSHEGKFSGEYAVAAALLDGAVGLGSFSDAAVRRPEAQRLIERTEVEERAQPPIGGPPPTERKFYAVVELHTPRGTFVRRVDGLESDRLARLDRALVEAKFRDCVAFSGTGFDADALLSALWNIDSAAPFDALRTMAAPASARAAGSRSRS